MPTIENVSVSQLRRILAIKEQIENLEQQLSSIAGEASGGSPARVGKLRAFVGARGGRRQISAAGKANIAAAARARWAKFRAAKGGSAKPVKKAKRKLSAAGRAAIIAAVKARWAKAKRA